MYEMLAVSVELLFVTTMWVMLQEKAHHTMAVPTRDTPLAWLLTLTVILLSLWSRTLRTTEIPPSERVTLAAAATSKD